MHLVSFSTAWVSSRVVYQSRGRRDSESLGEQLQSGPAPLGAPGGRASRDLGSLSWSTGLHSQLGSCNRPTWAPCQEQKRPPSGWGAWVRDGRRRDPPPTPPRHTRLLTVTAQLPAGLAGPLLTSGSWLQSLTLQPSDPQTMLCVCLSVCLSVSACLTLCDPTDCGPPGSSVHGILQARILEWVAMPSSKGSSRPRDRTCVSCIAGGFFTVWASLQTPPLGDGLFPGEVEWERRPRAKIKMELYKNQYPEHLDTLLKTLVTRCAPPGGKPTGAALGSQTMVWESPGASVHPSPGLPVPEGHALNKNERQRSPKMQSNF